MFYKTFITFLPVMLPSNFNFCNPFIYLETHPVMQYIRQYWNTCLMYVSNYKRRCIQAYCTCYMWLLSSYCRLYNDVNKCFGSILISDTPFISMVVLYRINSSLLYRIETTIPWCVKAWHKIWIKSSSKSELLLLPKDTRINSEYSNELSNTDNLSFIIKYNSLTIS